MDNYHLGFKLFRKRKNGTYGPLFINRKQQLKVGVCYAAEDHQTKGYAHRPGWHICHNADAPHLSNKDRVWCVVAFDTNAKVLVRPQHQGNVWYLANTMRIIGEV